MVNQTVLEYLAAYGKSYSLADLKKKITSEGYSEQEFNEAAAALGMIGNVKARDLPFIPESGLEERGSRRWMRFAGILGMIYLFLSIILVVAGFLLSKLQVNLGLPGAIVLLFFALLLFVSYLFFLKGFARMGRYTSKLLRFSSISLIFSSLALFVLGVVAAIIVWNAVAGLIQSSIGFSDGMTGMITSAMTGNAVSDVSGFGGSAYPSGGLALGGLIWTFMITFFLIMLFIFVVSVLFFTGLIVSGKQVRFAKIAGILGIVLMAAVILATLYIFMNPFFLISMAMSSSIGVWVFVIQVIFYALSWVVLLFETLTLFEASKKFEQEQY